MDGFTIFLVAVGVIIVAFVVFLMLKSGHDRDKAEALENKIRDLTDFDAADCYVSPYGFNGLAIDRGRGEILLASADEMKRFSIGSITSCEVLQDDSQIAYANRGSQVGGIVVGGLLLGGVGAVIGGLTGSKRTVTNVRRVVLRVVTNNFDKPNHDIAMIDFSGSNGVENTSGVYRQALERAELWHGRITAMMKETGDFRTN